MKRRDFIRNGMAAAAMMSLPHPLRAAVSKNPLVDLTFFHTNDTHAHLKPFKRGRESSPVGGFSYLASLIRTMRLKEPNSLLLSAGDVFQGTLFYNFFKGEVDFQCMNLMGYDAMVLGNHEFDDYQETLLNTLKIAKFPVLSANLAFSSVTDLNKIISPFVIREVGGVKVGIIGLTTDELITLTNPKYLHGVIVNDSIAILSRFVDMIRDKVDLVVVLSHIGLNRDLEIAAMVDGVDIIIGGHSHVALPKPVVVNTPFGRKVVVNQAGEWGEHLGMVKIQFNRDTGEWNLVEGKLLKVLPESGEDAEVKKVLSEYDAEITKEAKQIIGTTDETLEGTKEKSRTGETNLGNLIADAVREHYNAEIGLCNGGGIRASILGKDITIENVLEAFPFDNLSVRVSIKGQQLIQAFEHVSTRMRSELFGGFLHVSGCKVIFEKGEFAALIINGEPVDKTRMYSVAMSDFMAAGGDGFIMFKDVPEFMDGSKINDLIIEHIKAKTPLKYRVEGRITLKP